MGQETGEVLGHTFLGGERETLVEERLVDNLVTDGLFLIDVFGRTFLLHL